jgi:hypothetical protein
MSLSLADVRHEEWFEHLDPEEQDLVNDYERMLDEGIEQVDPDIVARYKELRGHDQ